MADSLLLDKPQEFRVLQPIWDIIKNGREDYLGSPLFPVFISVTFYFVAVLPFMVIDLYGKKWHWVQKYKIQPNKEVRDLLHYNGVFVSDSIY